MSLAKNIEFLSRLPKLNGFNGFAAYALGATTSPESPLMEVTGFGSNPGALKMFAFVPEPSEKKPALVVVLHGCGQTAAGYDVGAGWSALAQRYGFALLMPEQQSLNNGQTCFNWFNPEDITREQGEACSIRQMIARMQADHAIDPRRIFVTGLSAGGAMTSVMLATYPEVFTGGAIIAGLPYGIASNVREALNGMMHSSSLSTNALGDLVRNASNYRGPWPKVSVWHGSADRTVSPANADAIVRQWLDVHQLPIAPMSATDVDGHPREVWWNSDGETVVESFAISDMGHGTPLSIAGNDEPYGQEGAFLIEAGISSTYHIADFFGLTDQVRRPSESSAHAARSADVTKPKTLESPTSEQISSHRPKAVPVSAREQTSESRRRTVDIGAVITRALTAAGLMK